MSETLREAIQQSTMEEKLSALAELAREVFAGHGGPVALLDTENRTVGYLTPGADLAGLLPTDPSWVETMRRRVATPGRTLSPEEFLAALRRASGAAK